MSRMKLDYGLAMEQDRFTGSFVISVLRRTVATLEALPNTDVTDWLVLLPRHHERDEPIDRLLVGVFPELTSAMVRHYADDGPCLFEIRGTDLSKIDRQLAGFILAVAGMMDKDPQMRNLSLSAPQVLLRLLFQVTDA